MSFDETDLILSTHTVPADHKCKCGNPLACIILIPTEHRGIAQMFLCAKCQGPMETQLDRLQREHSSTPSREDCCHGLCDELAVRVIVIADDKGPKVFWICEAHGEELWTDVERQMREPGGECTTYIDGQKVVGNA